MKSVKGYLRTIFKDLWGIAVLFLMSLYLRNPNSQLTLLDFFYHPSKLILELLNWFELKPEDSHAIPHLLFTYIFINFFTSIILVIGFFTFHLLCPFVSKVVSSLMFPIAVYFFCNTYSDNLNWFILAVSIAFSIYRLYQAQYNHDSTVYEMSNKFFDRIFEEKPEFYISILFQWLMIFVDVVIIRTQELTAVSKLDHTILFLYLVSFIYISSYTLRENLTIYFAHEKLPAVPPSTSLDKIYIFFNARCFSVVKSFTLILSTVNSLWAKICKSNPEVPTILEERQSSTFDCAIARRSFLGYVFSPKMSIWQGELRKMMQKMTLREDMLSSVLICWMILYTYTKGFAQSNFIRIQESYIILFSHFFIVLEIFNSYLFVEIYKKSYGVTQNALKGESVKNITEDDVVTSKIEVNNSQDDNGL